MPASTSSTELITEQVCSDLTLLLYLLLTCHDFFFVTIVCALDLIIHLVILLVNMAVIVSSVSLVAAVLKVGSRLTTMSCLLTINPRLGPVSVSPGSSLPSPL